jgi:hypothetical protein
MKIEGFRTTKFRNTIKQIAKNNNADDVKNIKFHLGTIGETKSFRVMGVLVENVIASYWKTTRTDDADGHTTEIKTPFVITYSDYLAFNRDVQLSEVFGDEPVEVADFRRKKVEPEVLEVGKIYLMSNGGRCSSTSVIRIKKNTKTTATFEYISYRLPQHLQDIKDNANPEYHIECDLSELVLGETFGEGLLRCNASGSWRTSAGYGVSYIFHKSANRQRFVEEYYFD